MSMIPSSIGRVPNLLSSRIALGNITRTNVSLLRVQEQLATGRLINRTSDDSIRSATVMELNNRSQRSVQRQRNIDHGTAALGILDKSLAEASDLAQEAKQLALGEIGFPSNGDQRRSQAVVVQSMISSLYNTANRTGVAGYTFGGTRPGTQPFVETLGGFRYVGEGDGLTTDLGLAGTVPITTGANKAVGGTASRVRGAVDLNPTLTASTRLSDLAGARGPGIAPGVVNFSFSGGPTASIDLSSADTVQDVTDAISAAIKTYETDNGVSILGPGGVSFVDEHLTIDVAASTSGLVPALTFSEQGTGTTATDLGLAAPSTLTFAPGSISGMDLAPRLTWRTPVSALAGVTGSLGSIRIKNGSGAATIDLSGAQSLEDIKNSIESANVGVRVSINADGTGIDVINELAAGERGAMCIEEVPGSNFTSSRLGIRSLTNTTRIADFNSGRGVRIVDGATNVITGLPDPAADVDFVITLGDPAGTTLSIDLHGTDMTSVQTMLDAINGQAAAQLAAAGLPAGSFQAGLSDGANGLMLAQSPGFTGPIAVTGKNNSPAAEQLGLTTGSYDPASARLVGTDRARVRVEGLFSDLIDLRNSLETNDTNGIGFADNTLAATIDQLGQTRGTVGGFAQRVEIAQTHEEDRNTIDSQVRSQLQDLDYTEAATRFTLLQTQLQAAMQTTGRLSQNSLLDFLG